MAVKPVPDTYNTVTPYLIVTEAAKLVDFMKRAPAELTRGHPCQGRTPSFRPDRQVRPP